jgi:NAD(P)-dependent dehydrogenase (short-subunit alcohol dehydrogenase family)
VWWTVSDPCTSGGIAGNTVPVGELPSDNWRRVVDVNLNAVFYCMKAEVEVMKGGGGGAIVNTRRLQA